MTAQINVTPDQPSGIRGFLSPLLSIIGGIAAPFTGGASLLPAIGAGSAIGGAVGNLGGGIADSAVNGKKDFGPSGIPVGGNPAIMRRNQAQADNPLTHIQDAINVIHTLPRDTPEQQQAFNHVADVLGQGMIAGVHQQNGWDGLPAGPPNVPRINSVYDGSGYGGIY